MRAKLQKAVISFIISVYLSVHPPVCLSAHVEQLGCHWVDFYETLYFSIFQKSFKKIQVLLKCDKSNGLFSNLA